MRRWGLAVVLLTMALIGTYVHSQTAVTGSETSYGPQPGTFRTYTCADPAANTEFTCTVPAGKSWRLVSLSVTLVTDANVANRLLNVIFDDGANVYMRSVHAIAQSATQTVVYTAAPVAGTGTSSVAFTIATPPNAIFGPGYRIRSITTLIQAGDNYGVPVLQVEEWVR